MKIRQFHNDEKAVAYLIFYILASMFVFGLVYAIISDIRDASTVAIYSNMASMGGDLNDSDSLWGFDFVNLLLSFSITFFVIGLLWQSLQMAQKPETPW